MKKLYSLFSTVFVFAAFSAQTAFTATYDFLENPTNTDNGTLTGSNYTATVFSSTGVTHAPATANRYANSAAPTGALDTAKYIEVTLTPSTGYTITVNSLIFKVQRSGTGPRDFAVRSSVDNYAANLPATISPANAELSIISPDVIHYVNDIATVQTGATITPTTISDITSPVTLRFYPFTSEASTGTFSVDDVVISGTTQTATLGVNNLNKSKNIFLKNTVVDNTLNFQAKGNAAVKVYNMNGQLVKSAMVSASSSNVDVSSLAKGNYVVTAELNGEKVSQKIIKK